MKLKSGTTLFTGIYLTIVLFILGACSTTSSISSQELDKQLQPLLSQAGVTKLDPGPQYSDSDPKVKLGQFLMHDKILSGNKDISCATCHHATLATADNRPLPSGVAGTGLGVDRTLGEHKPFIPRHSPEVFNRNSPEWTTMFWDSRLSGTVETGFKNPAGDALPAGLDNILAAQAMFPVTSREEMRGEHGDNNELSTIDDSNFTAIWDTLFKRLMAIEEYRQLFKEAYPNQELEDMGFEHAANALAAFEAKTWTFTNSPFDNYLAGETQAISMDAKRGAVLFYGKAGCAACHSGNLMTDQKHYNVGIPQIGPGKGASAPLDEGRFLVTADEKDLFSFRTPPLRNIALTAPYMHNGAYKTLEDVVAHFNNAEYSLKNYNASVLPDDLESMYRSEESVLNKVLKTLDIKVSDSLELLDTETKQLVAFLEALTDPAVHNLVDFTPKRVPSGLSMID